MIPFQVGDPQEVNSIVDVFCKGRSSPLLIGSVKSNMGHSEPASGLCSIVKILIGMERGVIPPNLHFQSPNKDIPGLNDGRLQVKTSVSKSVFRFNTINFNSIFSLIRSSTNRGHSTVATWL